jgi:hypothetical protein
LTFQSIFPMNVTTEFFPTKHVNCVKGTKYDHGLNSRKLRLPLFLVISCASFAYNAICLDLLYIQHFPPAFHAPLQHPMIARTTTVISKDDNVLNTELKPRDETIEMHIVRSQCVEEGVMSSWIQTPLYDTRYFQPYHELSDFLDGSAVKNQDISTTDAICEFRPLQYFKHFPHAYVCVRHICHLV